MSKGQQEGGFVRNVKQDKFRLGHGRKASRSTESKVFKTYADRVAEERAARERWAGMSPLVVAREMIAEANLPDDAVVELSVTIVNLNDTGKLEPMIRSGKLADALAELVASAMA